MALVKKELFLLLLIVDKRLGLERELKGSVNCKLILLNVEFTKIEQGGLL